ncbi:ADP-dependent glucokinase/phosphofructokinase [Microbacterium sp. B24]|uniref:ADP-dependent glucokinase/phosphofructokinase n=1 Tax=Microbacterium sp. B24 TaxID=95616 RepID=UPI00040F8F24|nr:ADP-dependent glucokinase/phosphofructokinase [Microbacterium sp. B24]
MSARLVLGLGGTVDYEIRWDAAVISDLARHHGVRRAELAAPGPIDDERALIVAILALLERGVGGERFAASSDLLETFAARFETAVTLGGTGVRAGIALANLGIPSTQHLVSIDDNVRRLMPPIVDWVCSASADTLDPHLIVQYPAGAVVALADGEVAAPAANRVIVANDRPNREMAIAAQLGERLRDADAFLVSGFNTMQDAELLALRLDELGVAMSRLPAGAVVYYEDAGFYRREFAAIVRDRLISRIDVYGMNEDELQEYVGRTIDLCDPADVAAALAEAHRLIPVPALVVHTRFWSIAVGDGAQRHRSALDAAVRVSATRYRLGDVFDASDLDDTGRLPRHPDGARVVAAVEGSRPDAVGVAALVVDTPTPTTIGLGDSFVGGFLSVTRVADPVSAP